MSAATLQNLFSCVHFSTVSDCERLDSRSMMWMEATCFWHLASTIRSLTSAWLALCPILSALADLTGGVILSPVGMMPWVRHLDKKGKMVAKTSVLLSEVLQSVRWSHFGLLGAIKDIVETHGYVQ